MFCRHVFGNISCGFRGISRFLGNFVGFRGNAWISRVRDRAKYQKPCIPELVQLKLPYTRLNSPNPTPLSRVHQNQNVWLSGTGRNLRVVWTRQPLAWIVWSTSTFLIRKNKETVENCLQIMVELISNLKSHKSKPHTWQNKFKYSFWLCHSTVISFVFYQLHFSFKSKTIYKGNSVIKNIKCLIVFEFWVSN